MDDEDNDGQLMENGGDRVLPPSALDYAPSIGRFPSVVAHFPLITQSSLLLCLPRNTTKLDDG